MTKETIGINEYVKSGGFTVLPNILVDEVAKLVSPTAFVMLILVVRRTLGWHKATSTLSSRLASQLAGCTPKTANKALNELVEYGILLRDTSSVTHQFSLNPGYMVGAAKEARPANGRKRVENPYKGHPAIVAYRQVTKRNIKTGLQAMVAKSVGDEPANVQRWKEVVEKYIAKGWNPMNIDGMLDKYKNGFANHYQRTNVAKKQEVFF